MYPGSLTDITGLRVGHHTDARRPTGCTVVLCERGVVAGVDVRGAAPGTRETDLLDPRNVVEHVHALLLTGGSAFGLAAADGVMRWLDERGHGVAVGPARVPIVPAAVLFDLWVGDPSIRPDAASGYAACEAATHAPVAQGSAGAGTGATVGKLLGPERAMKGGIGSASLKVGTVTVAALVAVNAVGDVVDPTSGRVLAGARDDSGAKPLDIMQSIRSGRLPQRMLNGMSTTIGVVATDAALTKAQAAKVATMAHDGLARCIQPVHSPADGDTLFALATGDSGVVGDLTTIGALAAEVCMRAVLNAVRAAEGLPALGLPSARDQGWA
jgi:L-aminopeptidase/D-esterase-like protein